MAGPWDFTFRPQRSMADAFAQGVNLNMGQGLLDARAQGQAMRIQQQQAQQQALEFQQKQAALALANQQAALARQQAAQARAQWEALGPDATVRDMDLLIQSNPQAFALPGFKEHYERQSAETKKQAFSDLAEPFAALQNGDVDTAVELLDRQWAGYTNGNDEKAAKSRAQLVEMVKTNPEAARRRMFAMLSTVADKDQREGLFALDSADVKLRKDTAEAAKAEADAEVWADKLAADLGLTKEQTRDLVEKRKIDWARIGLDREKLDRDLANDLATAGQLSKTDTEGVVGAAMDSRTAEATAQIYTELADDMDKVGFKGEVAGPVQKVADVATEYGAAGYKTDEQKLRDRYRDLFGQLAIDRLAGTKGATSDKDAALATAGFPPATGRISNISKFIRVESEKSSASSRSSRFTSQFRAQNNGPADAKSDLVIDGVVIPRGTSLVSGLRRYNEARSLARGRELRAEGKGPDEIEEQLKREGYGRP